MAGPKQRLGFWYRFVAAILRPILMVITRRDWRGTEHLPGVGGGVVVSPNHISYADPLTFAHFLCDNGRAPRYLAKESVFRIPIVGRIIAACGQIPVYRESRNAARAFRGAVAAVRRGSASASTRRGRSPETRACGRWPARPARRGSPSRPAAPVIPVAQWGPQEILAPYAKRLAAAATKTIHVLAGPPVDLDDLAGPAAHAVGAA